MTAFAQHSVALDSSAADVWDIVRDFNSYPIWVNDVEDSYIEGELSGTAVGAVRNFALGGARTRQRLVAHSDAERYFTYEACAPMMVDVSGTERTLETYRGTLRLRPIGEGDGCLAEWSSEYVCPPRDAEYWADWWAEYLPVWLGSLRDHIASRRRNPFGVRDVPDPGGDDLATFAGGVQLAGSSDDANAEPWATQAAKSPASIEGMWSSRWKGEGFDWQTGHGRLSVDGDRVFILFDWENASKRGLIEARRYGEDRLVGRYLNLSAPEITRPWAGLIVDSTRIDGEHGGGRIDFRR
jgi:hypothetical protein